MGVGPISRKKRYVTKIIKTLMTDKSKVKTTCVRPVNRTMSCEDRRGCLCTWYVYMWGVSRKLATFEKMTVTGMYLRDLNVLLLHYPFMSNPRYCLGCATQNN